MQQATREKVALIAFFVLVVLFFGAVTAYLIVGHSWNTAATTINDHAGEMKDYTCILYRGTHVPEAGESDPDTAPASIAVQCQSYRDKEASVFIVDTTNPDQYRECPIYYSDGKRFGVFYAYEGMSTEEYLQTVEYLAEHHPDYTICLADNAQWVCDGSAHVDVCLSLAGEDWIGGGTEVEETYYANVPSTGKVGAVIYSQARTVSSKDIG